MKRSPRPALLLAGASLALLAVGYRWLPHPGRSRPASPPPWDVTFRDTAEEAGIRYTLGHGGKTPLSILEVSPGGCLFADLDRDGRLDIVLAGPPRSAAYRNLGNGRFQDVSAAMGLDRQGSWMGCTAGDFDGDGYPDLLLTGYGCLALLHNEGGRRFTDVTRRSGLPTHLWTTSAAFGDVDGDGWLDLYVGAYVQYRVGRKDLCRVGSTWTACGPEVYEPQRGGLYRNLGDGRFEDVTRRAGLDRAAGKTWGVAFGDYDDDGKPDLYLANDQVPGNLYHNLGSFRFEEVGIPSGTAFDRNGNVQGGMGVDWGDFDGDGRLDLFVGTFTHQDKEIYRNEGAGIFRPAAESAGIAGPSRPYVTFGSGFLDANNDGWLDLFLANGHIRDNAAVFEKTAPYAQPLQLFANQGQGRFVEVSERAGAPFAERLVGRGAAFGDYDNDGRIDLLVVDLEGRARLLHNEGGPRCGNWLSVRLEGRRPNREGIGARVVLTADGRSQIREVTRARSVLAASDSRLLFGIGAPPRVDRLEIRWPDGTEQELEGLAVNQEVTVRQPGRKAGTQGQPRRDSIRSIKKEAPRKGVASIRQN